MQNGKSYIRDSGHLLVTAEVVGLYPSIPHQSGLIALKEALANKSVKKIPIENQIKMSKFALKNNLSEFNNKVLQQISGAAIDTKLAPPYACIYMDRVEQDFLETQELQPLLWLRFMVH